MGANHARVVSESSRASLEVIVDVDGDRAAAMASRYGTRSALDLEAALECDAVILCTPTQIHVPAALAVIEAGVPILVEKPSIWRTSSRSAGRRSRAMSPSPVGSSSGSTR